MARERASEEERMGIVNELLFNKKFIFLGQLQYPGLRIKHH